jgi:8-amino-7-oxononanoate synthase
MTPTGADSPVERLRAELAAELDALDAGGLRRRPAVLSQGQGPYIHVSGRRCINLAANNPLGLANHPGVRAAARDALDAWGSGSGASRQVCGSLDVHRELETRLARFKGTEAALVFPTGYMANVGVLSALAGRGDTVLLDKLCHASLIDGARLSGARVRTFPHRDLERLEALLQKETGGRVLVVTDSIFSMDGDCAPLGDLAERCDRSGALLVVDEAHATGVLGPGGRGAVAGAGLEGRVPVTVVTLSKALGCLGGAVCGSKDLVEFLRHKARSFVYTTALPPSCAAAAIAAIDLVGKTPALAARARSRARQVWQAIAEADTPFTCAPPGGWGTETDGPPAHILPVVVGSADAALAVSESLLAAGVFAPAIRPPTVPAGTARIRLSFMAEHTGADLEQVIAALRTAGQG